jgi:DNA-binding NtrC family response regulator
MASKTRTVLVVEQEAALRTVVAQALATDGYRVLATGNGKDALRIAARHEAEVALLVTDLIVTGFDGGHLAELLTLDSPQMKVLYLDSGSASRTDTGRHLHALAWDATIIPLHERGWARALVRAVRDALRTIQHQPDHAMLDRVA